MILLTVEEIINLHSKLISRTGGSDGLRDRGLLESAVYSADATFYDKEAYPSIEEKSARLMYSLTTNHAFVDGNKRIGVLVMLTTLQLNGINLKFSQKQLIELGLSVANGQWKHNDILHWIKNHL